MKKIFAYVMCLTVLICAVYVSASAQGSRREIPSKIVSTEYLADGSFFVEEIIQNTPMARSNTASGSKTATHYAANGNKIWRVTVNGEFTYTSGVSATATSATATVGIIDSGATFVSKNAYVSGASAYGYGKVKYEGSTLGKTVVLTCDKYGNLS